MANYIEFSSRPLKSWIPAAVLGIISILAGISFIILFGAQYWYLSATLGLLGTTLLMRASPETYKFDGTAKSFLLVKRNLFGTKTFELSFREIKEVKFEESVDTQGMRMHFLCSKCCWGGPYEPTISLWYRRRGSRFVPAASLWQAVATSFESFNWLGDRG